MYIGITWESCNDANPDSADLGYSLRCHISKELPDDADDRRIHFEWLGLRGQLLQLSLLQMS